jgi:hypothetical protein
MASMCLETPTPSPIAAAPSPAPFRWHEAAVWLLLALALGGAMAWLAIGAEPLLRAPLIVFPLLVGACLGGLLVFLLRALQFGHRPTLLLGAAIAALAAIGGQHWLAHRAERLAFQGAVKEMPHLRMVDPEGEPPEGILDYLAWKSGRGRKMSHVPMLGDWTMSGAWTCASWALDGLLLLGAATLLVASAARLPYCRRCGSWFRTMRRGPLPDATGRALAALIDAEMPPDARSVKFRMSSCLGGCGPTGLTLVWMQRRDDFTSGIVWLDAAGRDRASAAIDSAPIPEAPPLAAPPATPRATTADDDTPNEGQ